MHCNSTVTVTMHPTLLQHTTIHASTLRRRRHYLVSCLTVISKSWFSTEFGVDVDVDVDVGGGFGVGLERRSGGV
jgi:hypothetical protein